MGRERGRDIKEEKWHAGEKKVKQVGWKKEESKSTKKDGTNGEASRARQKY